MDPYSSRKRKTPEPAELHDAQTPNARPPAKKLKVTQNQKQALMDNLQLEVTERARRLRAQYALQAQDLRSRIERRVNRIPAALRKVKMGDLLAKHEISKTAGMPRPPMPRAAGTWPVTSQNSNNAAPPATRMHTRSSAASSSDKENAPLANTANPSAASPRSNTAKLANASYAPAQLESNKILSPRSNNNTNSRTFQQSPFRQISPAKHVFPPAVQNNVSNRPASPLKTVANTLTELVDNARTQNTTAAGHKPASGRAAGTAGTGTGTRAASTQNKRKPAAATAATRAPPSSTAPPSRPATRTQPTRRLSDSSEASAATTIVRPAGGGGGGTGAASQATTAASRSRATAPRRTAAGTRVATPTGATASSARRARGQATTTNTTTTGANMTANTAAARRTAAANRKAAHEQAQNQAAEEAPATRTRRALRKRT